MKKIVLFISVLILIIGAISYQILPKQNSPTIDLATAMISVTYLGASAETISDEVTTKIESAVKSLSGYDSTIGYSQPNYALVFYNAKTSHDYTATWNDLRRKMESIQNQLPSECSTIEITTDFMQTSGFIISLTGPDYTSEALAQYADTVKESLSAIEGVSEVVLSGDVDAEIQVSIKHEKLNQLGMSYQDLANLLTLQTIQIPSGKISTDSGKIPIDVNSLPASIKDLENIIIGVSSQYDSILRLKDIADISLQTPENAHKIYYNQMQTILVVGKFETGTNIIPVGKEVDTHLESLKLSLPQNVSIHKVLFQPSSVEKDVKGFTTSLLQGILLVIAVVFIGLGFRNALLVSVAIPLSIFFTFSVMFFLGIEVHQISITALIIALGMLVDNAIVVSDSIQVKLDEGMEIESACIQGRREIAFPILTSTLTSICTFMPLLFIGGEIGSYLHSLPVIVITALSASYLVALFVTPTMAFYFFKPRSKKRIVNFNLENFFNNVFRHKRILFILIVLFLASSISLISVIGIKFFPFADTDILYVDLTSETGDDLVATSQSTKYATDILLKFDGVISVTSSIGDGLPRFFDTMFPAFPSTDYSQLLVKFDKEKVLGLPEYHSVTDFRDALQLKLNQTLLDSKAVVHQLEQGEPVGQPITIRLLGNDFTALENLAIQIESQLRQETGTVNVTHDYASTSYKYQLNLNSIRSGIYGVTAHDLQSEINIALMGTTVGSLKKSDIFDDNTTADTISLVLKSDISTLSELKNVLIKSSIASRKYLIKDFCTVDLVPYKPLYKSYNGKPAVQISSDVLSGYSAIDIQKQVLSKIHLEDYPDIEITGAGESESISRNFSKLGLIGLLFILIVYLILLIQFKSFLLPLVIMLTVPLSMAGAVWGLYFAGISLSFTALLGMISLAGVVVNNAIILIDFIQEESIRNENSQQEACLKAAMKRFRPILLSTTTTVTGLIPLVLMGSDLFTPMAIALMSGLMISTCLTLLVIPAVISIIPRRQAL